MTAMRLIDADKFILALMDVALSSVDEDTILDLVDSVPTVDAVPVVRCENCRYAMWVEWAKKYSCGQVRGLLVFGDHFCAFGKREYESRPQASL